VEEACWIFFLIAFVFQRNRKQYYQLRMKWTGSYGRFAEKGENAKSLSRMVGEWKCSGQLWWVFLKSWCEVSGHRFKVKPGRICVCACLYTHMCIFWTHPLAQVRRELYLAK
jgi:hypothetical protein